MIMNIYVLISRKGAFSQILIVSRLNRLRGFQQARADLEAADVKGRSTALHAAARAGNLGSAEALLRRRWDVLRLKVSFEAF